MEGIHTAVMEEHRDAYYYWHRMIDLGDIPPKGNYLLHIDHHDDLQCMGYGWDLTSMPKNAEEALEFTDQCLGIADFIIPAVWEGTFSTVQILKELIPTLVETKPQTLSLLKNWNHFLTTEEELAPGQGSDWHGGAPWLRSNPQLASEREVKWTLKKGGLNMRDPYPKEGLVLDVDLDYFCWDDSLSTGIPQEIEITPEAYRAFVEDRDHPLRILAGKIADVREEDGKYYIMLVQHLPTEPLPDDETIVRRINRLASYLVLSGVKPAAIDICRSAKSGYLPAGKAKFVEEAFLDRLGDIYPLSFID